MQFDILTLFPAMFAGPLTESILKRAVQAGTIAIRIHDIRAYATDRHHTADDAPYGGGAGMVMKAEPLAAAIRAVLNEVGAEGQPAPGSSQVVLMTPAGERFTQRMAHELAGYKRLVLVCGHYEGVDERVREALVDRELSIGDYVLTGGELAAMVVADAVARLVPGVIDAESTAEESHGGGLLEYPHYTRPAVWEGREVPAVLRAGHHAQVAQWRRHERLRRTLARRPDLLASAELSPADQAFLRSLGWQPGSTHELA
ncbi:MAG TPA: tRNA (guanosine(37)-N1)-methyltransferase TrmD [Kouleothrix sp.]|uniref:tRNA (guanosine(37)-N1)-methyltransferase TrmD n=1 Tax=Kouleothrix sp. TaxID=2779161 RepID=UPI002CD10C88|nr:tRNA (guanosine(37)-N1)-methyltransferase TrmD [Kouleothrix sp.]HRC76333.1 tRNA (guanosine(37)-N1)-methyltransferase TrmD [Kouleothrix sp.]